MNVIYKRKKDKYVFKNYIKVLFYKRYKRCISILKQEFSRNWYKTMPKDKEKLRIYVDKFLEKNF